MRLVQMAANKLHLPAMELLLQAGADPTVKDWRGKSVRDCLATAKRTNRLAAQKGLLLLDKYGNGPERDLAAKRLRERGAAPRLARTCISVPQTGMLAPEKDVI